MNLDAYEAGKLAYHECKKRGDWPDRKSKKDWQAGWDEEHNAEKRNEDEAQSNEYWESLWCNCPWLDTEDDSCVASRSKCTKESCAPFYFISNQG